MSLSLQTLLFKITACRIKFRFLGLSLQGLPSVVLSYFFNRKTTVACNPKSLFTTTTSFLGIRPTQPPAPWVSPVGWSPDFLVGPQIHPVPFSDSLDTVSSHRNIFLPLCNPTSPCSTNFFLADCHPSFRSQLKRCFPWETSGKVRCLMHTISLFFSS